MKQNTKYGLLFTLIILIFTVSEAPAFGANTTNKIEFLNNNLEVNVERESLSSGLSKIHKKTGIEFALDKKESDSIISVSFKPLPIQRALERILNKLNYAVVFGPEGKAIKVLIYSKSKLSLASPEQQTDKVSSFSNSMNIGPPSKEGMKISHGGEEMKITHGGKGMKITHHGKPMKITFPPDDMKITSPSSKAPAL